MKTVAPAAGKSLRGTLRVPGDKSVGHRALMLGALCEGGLRVRGLPHGEDVKSTRRCLEALGVSFKEVENEIVKVHGRGMENPFRAPGAALDCGNSGTTMRLLMGLLAGQSFEATLTGDVSLSRRPMKRVAEPLRRMGAEIRLAEDAHAPVSVKGRRPLEAMRQRLEVPSAQVKSAVLLAGLFADGETILEDSFASRDHTERMLAWLGADVSVEGEAVRLRPSVLRAPDFLEIPGDISSAAFFAGAAAMLPGSEITLSSAGVNPTRMGFMNALSKMGADVFLRSERNMGGEPVADLHVRAAPLRAVHVKPEEVPALVDELPLLAVLASQAEGESRLEGLGELRHKESDRLEGTAQGLRAMGAQALADGDALIVRGPSRLRGAEVMTLGDHRLAMAFTVAALTAEGETILSGADCVAISYPSFFEDLRGLLS